MTQITKEAIEAAKSAYWHEAHNGGGYSDKCYEAVLTAALPFLSTLPIAVEGKVPEGWQLVPIEPTDEILKALADGHSVNEGHYAASMRRVSVRRYSALLAAAPSSPGKDGGQEVEERPVGYGYAPEMQSGKGGFWVSWEPTEKYDTPVYFRPQPASTALVEAREAFCGMAEWLLQRKATGVSKYDTNRLFAECQKQRLAIDAALSSSHSTSREGER